MRLAGFIRPHSHSLTAHEDGANPERLATRRYIHWYAPLIDRINAQAGYFQRNSAKRRKRGADG